MGLILSFCGCYRNHLWVLDVDKKMELPIIMRLALSLFVVVHFTA